MHQGRRAATSVESDPVLLPLFVHSVMIPPRVRGSGSTARSCDVNIPRGIALSSVQIFFFPFLLPLRLPSQNA